MTLSYRSSWLRFVAVALLGCVCAGVGQSQDPSLDPEYGTLNLKAGFEPDPVALKLDAGGDVKTKLGGFEHWVAAKPDVRLKYAAGKYILSITVESEAETTLLVNLPDGKWIANHKGANGKNPLLKFEMPQAGTYDIFVGTIKGGDKVYPPAKLIITEKIK